MSLSPPSSTCGLLSMSPPHSACSFALPSPTWFNLALPTTGSAYGLSSKVERLSILASPRQWRHFSFNFSSFSPAEPRALLCNVFYRAIVLRMGVLRLWHLELCLHFYQINIYNIYTELNGRFMGQDSLTPIINDNADSFAKNCANQSSGCGLVECVLHVILQLKKQVGWGSEGKPLCHWLLTPGQ